MHKTSQHASYTSREHSRYVRGVLRTPLILVLLLVALCASVCFAEVGFAEQGSAEQEGPSGQEGIAEQQASTASSARVSEETSTESIPAATASASEEAASTSVSEDSSEEEGESGARESGASESGDSESEASGSEDTKDASGTEATAEESEQAASDDEEEEEEEEADAETRASDEKKEETRATAKRSRPKRQTIGWVERIRLEPEGLLLDAKLTPGSEGNVLHAQKIKTFEKDGETWVRFRTKDRKGDMQMLERPVIETNRFRTTNGSVAERYVVPAAICLGEVYVEIDFALSNRNAFEQEARIGRSTLAGQFIIDPSKTKTTKPRCPKVEE